VTLALNRARRRGGDGAENTTTGERRITERQGRHFNLSVMPTSPDVQARPIADDSALLHSQFAAFGTEAELANRAIYQNNYVE
jgi:hypothetical protein